MASVCLIAWSLLDGYSHCSLYPSPWIPGLNKPVLAAFQQCKKAPKPPLPPESYSSLLRLVKCRPDYNVIKSMM